MKKNIWFIFFFFFSSRRRHTRCSRDWSSDVCSSDLDLLAATERELARVQAQVQRKHSALRSPAQIGIAVGAVLNSKKMAKHFDVEVADGYLSWQRRIEQIVEEERLDGIYVIRTSMPAEHLDTAEAVQAYKDLSRVERAFRSMKTVDLEIRPIRHWTAQHVRAHVFLCMLAYHVEWHLREALARSEEHTSELQSRLHLVCRLLLEKKKTTNNNIFCRNIKTKQEVHT